ncbi:hypothetical protein ACX31A_09680 [Dermacoccus nishinomiyaensis]
MVVAGMVVVVPAVVVVGHELRKMRAVIAHQCADVVFGAGDARPPGHDPDLSVRAHDVPTVRKARPMNG